MKRFLSLFALVAVPALTWAADGSQQMSSGYADKVKSCFCMTPTSARDECWLARTDIGINFGRLPTKLVKKDRLYDLWTLHTIQPICRSDDLHNIFFGFAGIGTTNWKDAAWNVGLGYRRLTASADHMFGIGIAYRDMDVQHLKFRGAQAYVEWLTQYTTLTLSRAWDRLHVTRHATHHWLHNEKNRNMPTSFDLAFQFPGLPWTQVLLGRTWFSERVGRKAFHNFKGNSFRKLDYGLRLNILGCLYVEGGYRGGWGNGEYVRLVLSLGRPATAEYVLADGLVGNEVMTPRDLKNYTLAPVAHERVDTIAQVK